MDETIENESIVRMRTIVNRWLASENWKTAQLIDWFQGYDLPALGHEEEPYLWLLRGIPEADERYVAERKFANRVAVLLKENPDVKRPGKRPDQVLYNLFMLCAGLSSPGELFDPLFEVLERRQLQGKWRGVDVRTALKAALISNQKDSRLLPVWKDALLDGEQRFLAIDEYEFVDAARLMPPSAAKRGEPALDAIGKALTAISWKLEQEYERRTRFRTFINKVMDTYPGRPTWALDLLNQADRAKWSVWSVECLPSLHIPIFDNGLPTRTLTWHYLAACIPRSMSYDVVRTLCGDQVFELRMSDETANFIESIAPTFEENRLSNPYPSERSALGVVITSTIETGIDPRSAPIGDILRRIGSYDKEDLDDIIEPILASVNEGDISKDNVVRLAKRSNWPAPTVSYVEMSIAA